MKKIGIFILLVTFFACNEKLVEKPKNLIPRDKMVMILKEMAIINASKNTNIDLLTDNKIDPTTYVFNKFKIDSAQFVLSDKYYAAMPLEYESIYKEVDTLLNIDKERLQAFIKEKDSLKMIERQALKKKKDNLKK
ncbi:uncharacterized protein DUF4296 [Maribacter vaceletii]|uniref:Uncharacterized protein DUF4296 n=1 Tax=Maribacter vaceletii TaxID=1206816 RepID=A0A495EF05_9FLAO|nr:DUF4296 domain-containing protein [Maribacter vaceletii]RKR15113.1 uncharacterized protein DUF4296 [Maribacter vaceletii]